MELVTAPRKSGTFWENDIFHVRCARPQDVVISSREQTSQKWEQEPGETHAYLVIEFYQREESQKRLRECTIFFNDAQDLLSGGAKQHSMIGYQKQ